MRMAIPTNRKPVMTLYSGSNDPYSHRTRIVLFEKDIECQIIEIDPDRKPRELADLNPYNQVPTTVDRVSRAKARLMLMRFDRDWYSLLPEITGPDRKAAQRARNVVRDGLTVISPVFKDQPFILGDEFSLVDCSLAPILWRLDHYGIDLPRQAKSILEYAEERLFARKSFKLSLTEAELELRPKS